MQWLWWWWVVAGFALLGLEILTPGGFFVMFFGIAGVVVGMLTLAGLVQQTWMQWLLFSVLSVVFTTVFRKPLLVRFQQLTPDVPIDEIRGQGAVALETIKPGHKGKVELRGSAWNAINDGAEPLHKGDACRVVEVRGLQLHVQHEKGE
jgi:membrane protein implicated in regulation of membrane protease activity